MTPPDADPPPPFPDRGPVAVVVLAAGHGTRMRSTVPKPLHPVAGLPMVLHVLRAAEGAAPAVTALVVAPGLDGLAARLGLAETVRTVVQDPPLGTGHALRCTLPALGEAAWIVALFVDHPLLTAAVVHELAGGALASRARVTSLTCRLPAAGAYGRIVRDDRGRPVRIVERKDDVEAERAGPAEINSGMMVLDAAWARTALPRLQPSPATGEFYMTDLVALAVADGPTPDGAWPVATVEAEPAVSLGINDRAQLAEADRFARDRIRRRLMLGGVTLVGPETIFVDEDVVVGPDTTLLPHTILRGATVIGPRCVVGPHAVIDDGRLAADVIVRSSTIEQSSIESGSDVGPYAHLRGGTEIGPRVHIGNYAELKNARLAADVKVGHFSYLGDATVGANANIGAGTVTANFDGVHKHRTEIGANAFVGSDTILRAPVRVGDGATTGAGSVLTKDVPDGATAVGVPARVVRTRSAPGTEAEGSNDVGEEDP